MREPFLAWYNLPQAGQAERVDFHCGFPRIGPGSAGSIPAHGLSPWVWSPSLPSVGVSGGFGPHSGFGLRVGRRSKCISSASHTDLPRMRSEARSTVLFMESQCYAFN